MNIRTTRSADIKAVMEIYEEAKRFMQKILIRNGYAECGTIHLADGSERTAFQKY